MSGPDGDVVWLFGYGSLLWRPDFPWVARRPASMPDVARRLWQGSTDHRGVPDAPGRVVTLVDAPGAVCRGVAYALARSVAERVVAALDHRERDGYARRTVPLDVDGVARVDGLVWVAGPDNPRWLGDAPLDAIVAQVRRARGASGSNADYVHRLAAAVRALGEDEPHLRDVATLLDASSSLR